MCQTVTISALLILHKRSFEIWTIYHGIWQMDVEFTAEDSIAMSALNAKIRAFNVGGKNMKIRL